MLLPSYEPIRFLHMCPGLRPYVPYPRTERLCLAAVLPVYPECHRAAVRAFPLTFFATATPPAPVLIAIASWDSASVVVFSLSAPPTANINAAKPEDRKRPNSNTAVLETVATWLPPWGGSVEAKNMLETGGGGGIASLTRALAFIRFGTGSEGISLVAATGDGAIAVAEWQGGKGGEGTGHDTSDKSFLRGNFVTTASFQVGRGSVRLEVFQSAGLMAGADIGVERNGGGGERLFVNGDIMDAVVRRCSDTGETAVASDQRRGRWRCTQVSTKLLFYVERLGEVFSEQKTTQPNRRTKTLLS